jgi:regulatory protein
LAASAYLDGLLLLARRELSEHQLRQRLARKEHAPEDIDEAIDRLKAERALDDTRVAEAIARTQTAHKGRGRRRVTHAIERVGISREAARRATDAVFGALDEDAHLAAALEKRLRGRPIADDADMRRLFRHLVGQGFDTGRILAALKARRRT